MQREPGRARVARWTQSLSVICFLAAAVSMAGAGVLHATGKESSSGATATLGYALGLVGIVTGVLALVLDPTAAKEQS